MRRPSIKSPCIADRYAGSNERIAEFLAPNGAGGLIAVMQHSDGTVGVSVYRTDDKVFVTHADGDQTAANGAKLCAACGNDSWGECQAQPRADWRDEVVKEETSLGYWEWAAARLADEANSPTSLEEQANEGECREALEEAGWREVTMQETLAGFKRFHHAKTGRQVDCSTWAQLTKKVLSEVL